MKGLRGLQVAKIRGVEVKLHVSLIFILAYVWLIGTMQFPVVTEQAGMAAGAVSGPPLLWGGIFAFALFLSVLLHEFGHVIMAQRLGGQVEGITLMMLGGVSEIRKMPEERYQEFKVAVVGPLVSFAIAGVLLLSRAFVQIPEWSLFAYWLGSVNIVLGVFNLLPAFPMDGGRALRSLLAARQGRLKATKTAVKVGNFFAIAFAILGFLQFNILLVLIALFLYAVAHRELAVVESQSVLQGLRAGEVGHRISPIDERESLEAAVARMKEKGTLVLPVDTLSLEPATVSVQQAGKVPRELWSTTPVSKVMESETRTLDVTDSVSQALVDLYGSENQALPLKEDGKLVGLVRVSDLSQELQFRMLGRPPQERMAS